MRIVIFVALTLMFSCGRERTITEYVVRPKGDGGGSGGGGNGGGGGGGGSVSYSQIKTVLEAKCSPCHNSSVKFMASESGLKGSRVPDRVRGRSMPPPSSGIKLTDTERGIILAFFQ